MCQFMRQPPKQILRGVENPFTQCCNMFYVPYTKIKHQYVLPVAHACAHFDLIWPHLNNGQNGQNELNVQPCMVAIGFKSKKISFKHMFAIISMHEMHSVYLQVPNNTYFPSIFHSFFKISISRYLSVTINLWLFQVEARQSGFKQFEARQSGFERLKG